MKGRNIIYPDKYLKILQRYGFLFLLVAGVVLIGICSKKPIGDFGNYYYGSQIFREGKGLDSLYSNIHWFNEEIAAKGEKNFFENYCPVPPFSLLFYLPFTYLKAHTAKILFSLLSLLIFTLCYRRFVIAIQKPLLIYLPLALVFPLYQDFVQGQSYLLVCALLMEVYCLYEQKKQFPASILLALVFHLKIFPAFVLLYFVFKRDFRFVALILISIAFLYLLTAAVLGSEVLSNYYSDVFPRFLRGEVIDPNYFGHQGLGIFFNHLSGNPGIRALCVGLVWGLGIYAAWSISQKSPPEKAYAFMIFLPLLLSSYVTTYSLILVLPFLAILSGNRKNYMIFFLLVAACNLPLQLFREFPFVIQFLRIEIFLLLFFLFVVMERSKFKFLPLAGCCMIFMVISFVSLKSLRENVFVYRAEGVAYKIESSDDALKIYYCRGEKHYSDSLELKTQAFVLGESLLTKKMLDGEKSSGKIFFEGNCCYFLSDEGRGKGMLVLKRKCFSK